MLIVLGEITNTDMHLKRLTTIDGKLNDDWHVQITNLTTGL